jgi:DNA-binding SARP family transcriptional activator
MSILRIELFGGMHVTHNNGRSKVVLTREIQAFLAYLLLHRHRTHSREVLADTFWGENSEGKARGSLNTALWKLKKALEPEGIPSGTYLKNSNLGGVGFNRESDYWLDIEIFEEQIKRILVVPFQTARDAQLSNLEKVLALYKGELLEGCYKDWVLRERERLRALYLKSLIYLMQHYGFHGINEKAIACGQHILDLDPLREEIHRELMRLYLIDGQHSLAIRQYEICSTALTKELGISPMADTQSLYAQILRAGTNDLQISSGHDVRFEQALRQLTEASQTIELAREQIQQALQLITRPSKLSAGGSPSTRWDRRKKPTFVTKKT